MTRKRLLSLFFVTVVLSFVANPVFAQVNEPEIRSVAGDTVEFINYNGPHAVINTLDQIKSIGTGLGKVIAQSRDASTTAGEKNRYYVIHAVDPTTEEKLDADIMFIGANASVDHINNLRHIIASYLVAAYDYSEADAQTLAVFVTVYNAVYRGNMEVFQSRYKSVVTDNLTAAHAGLALNYQDWPGKSQIVIPLSSTTGGLGTVDTTVISDKEVIDSMREEEDMGIEDRKDLVDIKEREADQAEEKAIEAQEEAAKEVEKLKEEQQELREAQKEATEAKQEAQKAQAEAQRNPKDEQAQQKAEEAQQKAEEAQEAVEEQKQVVEEQKQVVEEKQKEAEEQQEIADQKREEARHDRAEIAKDQQKLIEKGYADTEGVFGLNYIDDEYSVLVKLDKANGNLLKESPVTVIRGRTIVPAGENFMAVAGTNSGNGAVKLVLLDTVNMEIVHQSNEEASENSVLVKDGNAYYAVIKDGGNWLIGKYNAELQLQMKSKIGVHEATPITLTESGLIVTDPQGVPRLLSYDDLSLVDNKNPVKALNEK